MKDKESNWRSFFRFDLLTLVLLLALAALVFARMETGKDRVQLEQELTEYQELESDLDKLLQRMNEQSM